MSLSSLLHWFNVVARYRHKKEFRLWLESLENKELL